MVRLGLLVLLSTLVLACAATEQTVVGRGFNHQIKNDGKQVEPGHWTGTWANTGIGVDNPGKSDEAPYVVSEEGTFDGKWTSPEEMSTCTGASTRFATYRDGSMHKANLTMICKPGPDGKLVFYGTGVFVDGTGRFAGIKGTVAFTAWTLTQAPDQMNYYSYTVKMTLPKK